VGAKNGFTHLQEQDGRKWKKKKKNGNLKT
jgi:hypothetical protein